MPVGGASWAQPEAQCVHPDTEAGGCASRTETTELHTSLRVNVIIGLSGRFRVCGIPITEECS